MPHSVEADFRKAKEYLYVNEDSCLFYCDRVYVYAVANRLIEEESEVLLLKAESLSGKEEYESVMDICMLVRENAQRTGNRSLLAMSLLMQGRVYEGMSMYDRAYHALASAQEIAAYLQDSLLMAKIYHAFGVLYDLQQDREKALAYYEKGLPYCRNSSDLSQYIRYVNNIALIYATRSDRREEAKAMLYDCVRYAQRHGLRFGLDRLYLNIGSLFMDEGNIDSALAYIDWSAEVASKTDNYAGLVRTLIYKGAIGYGLGNLDSARMYFEQAGHMADRLRSDVLRWIILQYQVRISKARGDYKEACDYMTAMLSVSDSLDAKRNTKNLLRMEMEQQAALQAELARKEKHHFILSLAGMGGVVLLGVCLTVLLYCRQKNKLKEAEQGQASLEADLEQANKKMVARDMYWQGKGMDLQELSARLKASRLYFKPQNQPLIDQVIATLESCANETPWEEFELRFEKVHTGFFKKLNECYSDLSIGEKRLCAYLRLNMTTKEIATLTHSSVRTIQQARYRLRKHLGIGKDEDLYRFMESLG